MTPLTVDPRLPQSPPLKGTLPAVGVFVAVFCQQTKEPLL